MYYNQNLHIMRKYIPKSIHHLSWLFSFGDLSPHWVEIVAGRIKTSMLIFGSWYGFNVFPKYMFENLNPQIHVNDIWRKTFWEVIRMRYPIKVSPHWQLYKNRKRALLCLTTWWPLPGSEEARRPSPELVPYSWSFQPPELQGK